MDADEHWAVRALSFDHELDLLMLTAESEETLPAAMDGYFERHRDRLRELGTHDGFSRTALIRAGWDVARYPMPRPWKPAHARRYFTRH